MRTAIIIGAGPAGLTAAYELLTKTDIVPIVIEADIQVGGLSKTVNYKGNKIDIGGHRFFSKSAKVIDWWLHFLPLDAEAAGAAINIQYQQKSTGLSAGNMPVGSGEKVMMVRPRKSRIYYHRKFFDYPLQLNGTTIRNLGFIKMMRIGTSYIAAKIFPERPEKNLAQFFRNRFGKELYETFFRDYTEKVWGVACERLPSSWGHQRVKDLNVGKVLRHAFVSLFKTNKSIAQEGTSTSLIEQFLYPKYGPGQMWETVADEVQRLGGKIMLNTSVTKLHGNDGNALSAVTVTNTINKETATLRGDYFFSTMPVKELVTNMDHINIPAEVRDVATTLEYRDFLIVGILVNKLAVKEKTTGGPIKDNWIYIQDNNVKAGRLQIFNNWSPFMISNPDQTWLGVEYFCNETDSFWQMDDAALQQQAIKEMEQVGILQASQVLDSIVVKVKKAYPSYYGGYDNFSVVQSFLDHIENLFLIGRNGMHRYNNSDHSMLTAMTAVENIINGVTDKSNIWEVNTEEEYHEGDK
jgi:protoporphyrinogen oxidase